MKKIRFAILAGALACMAWSGTALADGVLIAPSALAPAARATLESQVRDARATNPDSFARFAAVVNQIGELDAKKRGRYPVIGPVLHALGPDGLFPMLEAIALDSPPPGQLSDDTWTAWRAALLESVGSLRDQRSTPVLEAVLNGPNNEYMIVQAAAGAYGKLETDAAAARLIAMSREGAKHTAVLSSMGNCRRTVIAQRLAEALAATNDVSTAKLLAHSLGDVGSAWAWNTGVSHPDEQDSVRSIAASALITAVARHEGEARSKLVSAVLMVDHPSTQSLIEQAKRGASAQGRGRVGRAVEAIRRESVQEVEGHGQPRTVAHATPPLLTARTTIRYE